MARRAESIRALTGAAGPVGAPDIDVRHRRTLVLQMDMLPAKGPDFLGADAAEKRHGDLGVEPLVLGGLE